ncbi:MAG: response regulator transcription factor [Pseudomonadota bacterium]
MINTPTTIAVVESHPFFLRGLREFLATLPKVKLVAEAKDEPEAIRRIRSHNPDIALIEYSEQQLNGLDLVARLNRCGRAPKCILMSVSNQRRHLKQAMTFGVLGYIPKNHTESELVECLDQVRRGKHFISSSFSQNLVATINDETEDLWSLTRTEKKVLMLVSNSKSSAEIAGILGTSIRTINNHRHNICKKLDIRGPNCLLRYATKYLSSERLVA